MDSLLFLQSAGLSSFELRIAAQFMGKLDLTKCAVHVPKRGGGSREAYRLPPELRHVLRRVNGGLQSSYMFSEHVHGYIRGRSNSSNARPHLGADTVLRIDLKDFFGQVGASSVSAAFQFSDDKPDLTKSLMSLCAPQGIVRAGFSTSSTLANFAFVTTDIYLASNMPEGVTYTRYGDDLTFSTKERGQIDCEFEELIVDSLSRYGWVVNGKKTRLMHRGNSQFVTGISVADETSTRAPITMKRRTRQQLYYLEKHGYPNCVARFPDTWGKQRLSGMMHYINRVEERTIFDIARLEGIDFGFDVESDVVMDRWLDEFSLPATMRSRPAP